MDFELTQHIKRMEDISGNSNCAACIPSYITDLKKTIKYKNSTTRRRTEFETLNLEKVNYVKSALLIVYGLLVLWFTFTLFKNKDMSLQRKGILLGITLVYPYIAPPLLIYLYETLMYIVAIMTGEIYKKTELQ